MPEPPRVVLMGVAGSGKSTVGPRLSSELGVPFVDGDDAHTDAAKAQMAAGQPLDDAERAPWLDRLHTVIVEHAGAGIVLACSALKQSYRRQLAGGLDSVAFVALVAPTGVLEARLESRVHHFAGASLLPSQLDTLELGDDVMVVDSNGPVEIVADAAARAVRERLRL